MTHIRKHRWFIGFAECTNTLWAGIKTCVNLFYLFFKGWRCRSEKACGFKNSCGYTRVWFYVFTIDGSWDACMELYHGHDWVAISTQWYSKKIAESQMAHGIHTESQTGCSPVLTSLIFPPPYPFFLSFPSHLLPSIFPSIPSNPPSWFHLCTILLSISTHRVSIHLTSYFLSNVLECECLCTRVRADVLHNYADTIPVWLLYTVCIWFALDVSLQANRAT